MVQGLPRVRRKLREAPKLIHERLVRGMERIADDIVRQMSFINPLPGEIVIDWTWGTDVPRGAITVAQIGNNRSEGLRITIYARGKSIAAGWFEFGTNPRFHKSGKSTGRIVAQPFFFPVWRANRRSVRNRLNGILRRAVRRANSL